MKSKKIKKKIKEINYEKRKIKINECIIKTARLNMVFKSNSIDKRNTTSGTLPPETRRNHHSLGNLERNATQI